MYRKRIKLIDKFIILLEKKCREYWKTYSNVLWIYAGRRTRAALAKSSLKTSASNTNGLDALAAVDQHFASPKRKDFKLDTDAVPSICTENASSNGLTTTSTAAAAAATINGRRTNKTASSGSRSKKPSPKIAAITNYFAIVDESPVSIDLTNGSSTTIDADTPVKLPAPEQSPDKSVQTNGCEPSDTPNAILSNAMLMSPELKSLPNDMKQTTPHRIVCHSSPSTKRRPYAKDTAQVFSNLNICDSASPKPKGNRRRHQPKSRRKLNVENNENGEANEFAVPMVPSADGRKDKSISNNNFVANGTAAKHVRDTLMNDYFPIRRSVRKTQKAIEEEQMRYIEKAIGEQRQDGLSIRDFEGKGRGIVAARPFQRGEFVVEYIGELIDQNEADKREERYMKNVNFGCYMYYFRHKEQQWW